MAAPEDNVLATSCSANAGCSALDEPNGTTAPGHPPGPYHRPSVHPINPPERVLASRFLAVQE
jgi:hypothetical protein